MVLAVTAPLIDHGRQHVMCDERAVGAAARTAHAAGLGVAAPALTPVLLSAVAVSLSRIAVTTRTLRRITAR